MVNKTHLRFLTIILLLFLSEIFSSKTYYLEYFVHIFLTDINGNKITATLWISCAKFIQINCLIAKETLKNSVECPCGVVVKALVCGIVVSEFELQLRHFVHFRANSLGKGMNPLILPAMRLNRTATVLLDHRRMDLSLNNPSH